MQTPNVIIKQNDTLPVVSAVIKDALGKIVNLTSCTVTFNVANEYGVLKFSKAAVIVDAVAGKVEYRWSGTDTDTVGMFKGEFKVTFPDTKRLTAPNADYLLIQIIKEIA